MSTFESTSVDFIWFVSEQTQQFLAAHAHRRTVRLQVADDPLATRRRTAPGSQHCDAPFDREVDLGIGEKAQPLANLLRDGDLSLTGNPPWYYSYQ
jgi:hypothetical protein